MPEITPTESALSGEWWLNTTPFRHFRAENVLPSALYDTLAAEFMHLMNERKAATGGKVGKNANYDANIVGINSSIADNFGPFFTAPWLEAMHRIAGLPNVQRVDGALHSSAPGSRTGWIHTDFCSAWFDEPEGDLPVPLYPDRSKVDYFSGTVKDQSARPKEYIRAATLIFYLCNDDWQPGEGGETGLYSSAIVGPHTTTELVPPVNNTLLLFPCNPHSHHRFITNPGRERNSIILWVHATVEDATNLWGAGINRRSAP